MQPAHQPASSAVNVTTLASSCTTKPSAPTGLAASGTTDSSTNLSWNAVTPPSGCTITNYTVLQNGSAVGTTTTTSYTPATFRLQPATALRLKRATMPARLAPVRPST